jgi:hypothetical protein
MTLTTSIEMNQTEILSAQDFATECGVTVGRVRQWISAGRLQSTRLGKWTHAISRQEAERFKRERQREANR